MSNTPPHSSHTHAHTNNKHHTQLHALTRAYTHTETSHTPKHNHPPHPPLPAHTQCLPVVLHGDRPGRRGVASSGATPTPAPQATPTRLRLRARGATGWRVAPLGHDVQHLSRDLKPVSLTLVSTSRYRDQRHCTTAVVFP